MQILQKKSEKNTEKRVRFTEKSVQINKKWIVYLTHFCRIQIKGTYVYLSNQIILNVKKLYDLKKNYEIL